MSKAELPTAGSLPDRGEILRPYVEGLSSLGRHASDSKLPSKVTIGARSFEIDHWVRQVLPDSLVPEGDGAPWWQSLLAEGLALQSKILSDFDRAAGHGTPTDDAPDPVLLQLDAAMGYSLMTELQRAVDHRVISGDLDLARKLTQFKNKLGQSVSALKEQIGQSGLDDAERMAASMVRDPAKEHRPSNRKAVTETDVQTLLKLEEDLLRQKGHAPRTTPSALPIDPLAEAPDAGAEPEKRSRRAQLALLLALLLGAWLVFTVRPALTKFELPVLERADFGEIGELRQVVARPPSLFVSVDAGGWDRLDPAQRERLVGKVGKILAAKGYSGAQFTDTRGRVVARWLSAKGIQLVAESPAAGP